MSYRKDFDSIFMKVADARKRENDNKSAKWERNSSD